MFPGQQKIRQKGNERCRQHCFAQRTDAMSQYVGPTRNRPDGNHVGLGFPNHFSSFLKFLRLLAEGLQHRADLLRILRHGIHKSDGPAIRGIRDAV